MDKLYVVIRADLPVDDQAVQGCHAAIQFTQEHPEVSVRWFEDSNHLALLSATDANHLVKLVDLALDRGIKYSIFLEPDLGHSLTAIALEPAAKGLCRSLPKAFQK